MPESEPLVLNFLNAEYHPVYDAVFNYWMRNLIDYLRDGMGLNDVCVPPEVVTLEKTLILFKSDV